MAGFRNRTAFGIGWIIRTGDAKGVSLHGIQIGFLVASTIIITT